MARVRSDMQQFLAHWEHRSVQLISLAGLLLALVLASLVPYGHGPRGGGDVDVALAARAHGPSPVVLPPPKPTDARAQAVLHAARTTKAIRMGGGKRRLVALTFDDGPGPYTKRVLATLERLHAPATFFQVGRMLADFSDAAAAESEAPDVAIGDHTFNHRPMAKLDRALQRQEILGAAAAMTAHGEAPPRLFRPPYGEWDADTHALLRARGMAMIMWSVDSQDYERPGVKAIVHNVMSEVTPGAIVLMHDGGGDRSQTIAALPFIVHRLRRLGYGLVTVPDLLLKDPPAPQP